MQPSVRFALLACFGAISLLAEVPSPSTEPQAFLKKYLDFSKSELANLEKGRIMVELPKTPETREVAVFAITRVEIPVEFFVRQMRDIVNFKRSDNVLQIGKFSDPPRLEDLAGLTLDPREIETIQDCEVGKCDFKMSASFIERFRNDVDWSEQDYGESVTALTRQMLLEHVRAYLQDGNAALGDYADKSYTLHLADELQNLLQPTPYMYRYEPEFQKYLEDFPNSRPARADSFVYWSKESFGLKPVISVTHVTVYGLSAGENSDVLIASKGIYANHYFEASLGLTAFVHGNSPDLPRTYLIYVNRTRTDGLRGFLAGLKRSMIGGRVRNGARKSMEVIKEKLESDYAALSGNPADHASSVLQ